MARQHLMVPDSCIFYLQNDKAMNLLGGLQDPPESFKWAEIGQFYQAKFAYQRVMHEYYFFMRELWEQTWGDYFDIDKATLTYTDAIKVNDFWENWSLPIAFQSKKYTLMVGVWFFDDGQYGVYFLLEQGDKEISVVKDIERFSSKWELNSKEECWEAELNLSLNDMDKRINLTQLRGNVREAMGALAPYIEKQWLLESNK